MAIGTGVLWKGKYFVLPQAASSIDSSALSPVQLGSDNVVALLADFTGLLAPKTATKIGNAALANSVIHPDFEEARLAAQLLFAPSPSSPGASEVYLIPVNAATGSTVTLNGKLKLTSYMYGLAANQIKAKVETIDTVKTITVQFQDEKEVFNKLTKSAFSIQYTGAGSASALTITPTAAAHILTITCTGAAADDVSLDLNVFNTVQKVIDAISAKGVYTITTLTESPRVDLSMQLDAVSGVAIKASAATVTANLQATIDAINKLSGYVKAERIADTSGVVSDVAWTYLTGGTAPAAVNNDWDECWELLKTLDVDIIVPLTSSPSIHSAARDHCNWMSGVNGKSERRCFVGGANNLWTSEVNRLSSLTSIKSALKALGGDRVVHTCIGSKHYDPNGNIKLYPGYVTACMYAGIAGGSTPVEPLTRKYLNCLGLEVDLRPTEIDDLIEARGAVPIPDRVQGAGYVISRQITTWGQDADLYRIEYSVGRGADYIASQVRQRHELMIGKPGTEAMDLTIINITNAVLERCKRDGYIRDYDPKATQLRVDGTTRYVDYSALPILPINHIFSTYHLMPVSFVL